MKNKLYRKKYIISIYEKDNDTLAAVLSNTEEFAEYFGITEKAASMILSRLFNKQTTFVKHYDSIYYVYFVEDSEDEN